MHDRQKRETKKITVKNEVWMHTKCLHKMVYQHTKTLLVCLAHHLPRVPCAMLAKNAFLLYSRNAFALEQDVSSLSLRRRHFVAAVSSRIHFVASYFVAGTLCRQPFVARRLRRLPFRHEPLATETLPIQKILTP